MPARKASPRHDDDDMSIRDKIRAARDKKAMAKYEAQMERQRTKRHGDKEANQDFEDNLMLQLEQVLNFIIASVAASLPASQDPADYWTAGILVILNVVFNALVFRAQWSDRLLVYVGNFVLWKYSYYVRMMAGRMGPLAFLALCCTNTALLAGAYWYHFRTCSDAVYSDQLDLAVLVFVFGNLILLTATQVIPVDVMVADFTALR
eukprot:TRINITY_DN7987_c2_g1_i1.p1 TRINITY_DN7987_c2_g1~~TRINITY_DN7987_c2_g1_i1.p1  ORF type:complete len:206 (+),score=70.31 TRINITY_DN7987_c2_g1_i1:79-696(+)